MYEIILIAIGLSMDSLAVSVSCGTVMRQCTAWNLIRISTIFAFFQASMAIIGYMAGMGFEQYINTFDHWIAFLLLLYLGGKMIFNGFKPGDEEECKCKQINNKSLCGMGIATSIDALAVGVSLALLNTPLIPLAAFIGGATFLFSASGFYLGCHIGKKTDIKLEVIGGVILIGIGIKILVEHLIS
jgi:putative Mn2+ efflux pump MntP